MRDAEEGSYNVFSYPFMTLENSKLLEFR